MQPITWLCFGYEFGARVCSELSIAAPRKTDLSWESLSEKHNVVIWEKTESTDDCIRRLHQQAPFVEARFLTHHPEAPPTWTQEHPWAVLSKGLRGYGRTEPESGRILVEDFSVDADFARLVADQLGNAPMIECFTSEKSTYRPEQIHWLRQELRVPLFWPELYPVLSAAKRYKFSLCPAVYFGSLNSDSLRLNPNSKS
jgi:hypothetical protein